MRLKTFPRGGVHPPENKISVDQAIQVLSIPSRVQLHLGQHLGAPAVATVSKGDCVRVGSRIAEGKAFISAHLHSSVSGTVAKIDDVIDASGYRRPAVVIDVDGDEWEAGIDRSPELIREIKADAETIVERIKAAGVVGLGGACFPTHVKYMFPEGRKADTVIINAVECEPYLTADHRLMLERTDEILVGVQILMKVARVERAMIGVEANKPDAIETMSRKARSLPGIEVIPLKVQYPQGAEKQLIKALLNREVPSGRLPLDVGCVVNNVGTALAVYEAVQKNKPLVERVVTFTGSHLPATGNFLVRLGVPAMEMAAHLGVEIGDDTAKVISGGPMMGKAISGLEVPVTKGTSGIVLLTEKDARRSPVQNCIRCGRCVSACPMGLEPWLLEKLGQSDRFEECDSSGAADCIECGSCSFACPSSRSLLDFIRYGKVNVMRIRAARRQK
ncbi:MAG TPA: electron transport complex subunit RsxC [Candidatus Aminicenantes bacterium]|nr:electron transport complex subunit RsxC [Candidatus Aminicenantes bacterium]